MTLLSVLNEIERAVLAAGTAKQLAHDWKISDSYLCDVRLRRRLPGKSILEAMGLRAVIEYERVPR